LIDLCHDVVEVNLKSTDFLTLSRFYHLFGRNGTVPSRKLTKTNLHISCGYYNDQKLYPWNHQENFIEELYSVTASIKDLNMNIKKLTIDLNPNLCVSMFQKMVYQTFMSE